LHQVEPARLQISKSHGRVRNRQIDDPVDLDLVVVPIVGEALDDDAILSDPLNEFEWAGANRL
jgi:hypothetical protein